MGLLKKIFALIGWLFLGLIMLGVLSVLVLLVSALQGGTEADDLGKVRVKTDHGVGIVELSGEIFNADRFLKLLKKAVDHEKLKAIVVRIESPGGSVGVSEEIYREIKDADSKKPTVCSMGNVAASGGLYAALGCRKIVANEGTLTGSIGVILMMPHLGGILDRVGFEMNVVKSGRFKDTGSPFRKFETEDRQLLQRLVNKTYEQFLRKVSESRGLAPEVVREFADGRIILGEEAVDLGLVDQIGGLKQAARLALTLAGDDQEPELVRIKKASGFLGILEELRESEAMTWFLSLRRMRLLYQAYS